MVNERKNIVVVGAGFGGLRTALLIGKKLKKLSLETRYRIVLIDQNEYHTYTPTLYEVATNDPEYTSYAQLREIVTMPISSLTSHLPIDFVNATVERIDLKEQKVLCKEVAFIRYEHLILAPGSEPNFFDIPGLEKNSTPLKTFRDSIEIREYILAALKTGHNPVRIVIGGGGSAGVELAGEVRSWLNKLHIESRGLRRSEVSIIETALTVLAPFSKKVINRANKRLAAIGVKTITNERINGVRENLVMLATGKTVPFDVLIWSGGVKPSSLTASLELKKDARNRILVSETMECLAGDASPRLDRKIYGLGDAVIFINPKTNQPVPGTAHAALVQADIVAHNLVEDIKLNEGFGDAPRFKIFTPANYPYIIPIGAKFAIAQIGNFTISGFFGWILKGMVELMYLSSLMPFPKALSLCLKGLRIIIKNDKIR